MEKKLEDAYFKRLIEVLDEETQSWWAKKISVSQGTISNIYKKKYTTMDKIIKILLIKKISPNWLICGTGPKEMKFFNEQKIGDLQDRFRVSQEKIAELEYSNLMLNKKLRILKNKMNQNEIMAHGDVDNMDILGLMTVLRTASDVIFKMAEVFAKNNMDVKKYGEILDWFKNNLEVQKHSTAAAMENLNQIIKTK